MLNERLNRLKDYYQTKEIDRIYPQLGYGYGPLEDQEQVCKELVNRSESDIFAIVHYIEFLEFLERSKNSN